MRLKLLTMLMVAVFGGALAAQTTFGTSTGLPLAVPDNTPAGVTLDIPVTTLTNDVTAVSLTIQFSTTHSWAGDLIITLTAPGGAATANIVNRVGRTGGTGFGDNSDFQGFYVFVDGGADFWAAAAAAGPTVPIPAGSYAATGVNGVAVVLNTVFGGLTAAQANGTWQVNVSDNGNNDVGSIGALSITITEATGSGNANPVITVDRDSSTTPVSVTAGSTVTVPVGSTVAALDLEFTVTDADSGDTITLNVNDLSADVTGFVDTQWEGTTTAPTPIVANPSSGTFNTVGTFTVTLTADDGAAGGSANFSFDIQVNPANSNPVITVIRDAGGTQAPITAGGTVYVLVGSAVSELDLRFSVTDVNTGDDLELTATVAPSTNINGFQQAEWDAGPSTTQPLLADPDTGTFDTVGTISVTLDANDGAGGTATLSFTISVLDGNSSNMLQTRWDTSFTGAGGDPSAVMFDAEIFNAVEITDLYSVFGASTTDVSLYYRIGTYVGNEQDAAGWILHETVTGIVGQGANVPVRVEFVSPLALSGGTTYGIAILTTNIPAGPGYTSGVGVGTHADANIELTLGAGVTDAFATTGTIFAPRVWNGALVYNVLAPAEIDVERPAGTSVSDPDVIGNQLTGTTTNVTWTIVNNGGSDLIITGDTVALSGGFNLTGLPASVAISPTGAIAPGGSATFTVGVNPTADAPFGFTVTIASNDPATPSFVFDVEGDGVSNAPPTLALGTTSGFADLGGSTFGINVDPGASIVDGNLEVDDATPDDVDMTITFIGGPMGMTIPSGFTVPGSQTVTTASMPFAIQWGGTAGAGDAPGNYDWDVELDDGVSIVNYTVRVTINDLDPEHAAATGITGDGSSGDPYATTIQIGATGGVDVADLTDPNANQDVVFDSQSLIDRPTGSALDFTFSVTAGNPTVLVATPDSAPVLADVGDHEYQVFIEDDADNNVSIFVTITVAGTPPAFTSGTPPATVAATIPFSFTFTASGNPAPTFAVTTGTLPAWATLNPTTGELSGTPVLTEDISVTISAQNGIAPDATQAITITVAAAAAPSITSAAPTATATVGTLYSFTITATGNPTPTFSIAGNPLWLSIDANTGVVSGTPAAGDVGTTGTITVTASNGVTPDADVSWTITVSAAGTGGGGGGSKKKSGCSTDESSSYLLLALLGLIGAVVVSTRLRRA